MRLEYRLAFDLAWSHLAAEQRGGGRLLTVLSAVSFVKEVLLRLEGPAVVVADSSAVAAAADRLAGNTLAASVTLWRMETAEPCPLARGECPAAVWAVPQVPTWRRHVRVIHDGLGAGAVLAIVTQLPGHVALSGPGHSWPGTRATGLHGLLVRLGYRPLCEYHIGGPPSLLWAGLGRVAGAIGRPDLADRCEAGYRLTLATPVRPETARLVLRIYRKGRAT